MQNNVRCAISGNGAGLFWKHCTCNRAWCSLCNVNATPSRVYDDNLPVLCSIILLLLLQPFYDPLSGTTQVSQYQKGKPFWILLKQRWWGGSGISWTICKLFALCSRSLKIIMPAPHHSHFYWPDALPDNQPTASKHWRQTLQHNKNRLFYPSLCMHKP